MASWLAAATPADRSAYALEVTASGRRWLDRTPTTLADAERQILAGLDTGERKELLRLLQKVVYGAEVPR